MRKQWSLVLAIILMYSLGNIFSINKVSAQTRETKGEVLAYVSDGIPVGTRLGTDGFEENRKEVKNNMLTAFLAQGAITTIPNTEAATETIKTITDLTAAFSTWQMMFIAIFLAADIILGIAAAIASKEFNFNKVAAFMKTGVIPYLFGFAVVELFASQFGQVGQIATTAIFVAIVLNLLGSIVSNLANLGVNMPTVLKKKG